MAISVAVCEIFSIKDAGWSTSTSAGQAAVSAQRRCTIDLIAADDDDDDDDAMF